MKKQSDEVHILPLQDLLELAKIVNVQAVLAGWWGVDGNDLAKSRHDRESVVTGKRLMIASEVIEALGEYRDKAGEFDPTRFVLLGATSNTHVSSDGGGAATGRPYNQIATDYRELASAYDRKVFTAKPEGFLIELADVFIRILDLAAALGETREIISAYDATLNRLKLGPVVDNPHDIPGCLSALLEALYETGIYEALEVLLGWCAERDWPLYEAAVAKHAYNKTRPYRHGNKRI